MSTVPNVAVTPLKVLDVSHHNVGERVGDPINFAAIYDYGVRGIIHKASQGTSIPDKTFKTRRQAIKDAGLLLGAYHFATDEDIDDQVKFFIDMAMPDDTMLMALDHEPNNGRNLSLAGARAFIEKLEEKIGRKPVIYSGNLIKEQTEADPSHNDFFAQYRLWLAQYGPKAVMPSPWSDYWLWQFSGDGVANRGYVVPGIFRGHTVDMNTFAGTDDELAQQWAG